ncbi:MAG: hypothetical protein SangKO_009170 [Sandaracinaceae bacterium]
MTRALVVAALVVLPGVASAQGCPDEDPARCVSEALDAAGEEATAAEARARLESWCEGGEREACWGFAHLLARGQGGDADEARAEAIWTRSCDAEHGGSCLQLGVRAERAGEGQEGLRASIPFFERACRAAHGRGCEYAADNLLLLDPGPDAAQRGAELFGRACQLDHGARACGLAAVYRRAIEAEPSAADDTNGALERECEGGSMEACDRVGARLLVGHALERSPSEGIALLRRACAGGLPRACYRLGRAFEAGLGVERSEVHARALLDHACEGGHAAACGALASLEPEGAQRRRLLVRACEGGDPDPCVQLAAPDYEAERDAAAYPRLERACAAGHAVACRFQGIMLYSGRGVAADPGTGGRLFHDACAMGDGGACPR